MYKKSLVVDAWIKEAQEAAKLVEDLEVRMKNNNNPVVVQQQRLIDKAQSKLLEVGVKLDRLESLLHNPPSKPILTDEDLGCRWKMLLDIQQRTKALVLTLYASSSPMRCLPPRDAKETCCSRANRFEQDQTKASLAEYDPEQLEPLISNNSTQSQVQLRISGFISLLWKACWIIGVVLGAAALLFILVVLCSVL